MSIRDEIRARVQEGRLALVEPVLPGQAQPRVIYAAEELHREIVGPWDDPSVTFRMARLRADLDRFTTGGMIVIGGTSDRHAYLKPLDPVAEQVWEIRSVDPKPSFRVFGRFAERDVFIATHMELRTYLGEPSSFEWKEAIRLCKAKWRGLLPAWLPLSGGNIHDYISQPVFDLRNF